MRHVIDLTRRDRRMRALARLIAALEPGLFDGELYASDLVLPRAASEIGPYLPHYSVSIYPSEWSGEVQLRVGCQEYALGDWLDNESALRYGLEAYVTDTSEDTERFADHALPLLMALTLWAMDRWPDANWS
jgi:hypothetical protein